MAQVDDAFGQLLHFIDTAPGSARALSENTLVFLSSDNGPAAPLPARDFFGSARPFRGWKGRCAQLQHRVLPSPTVE
jgi:arylsulfatase A-like enzyme